MFKNFRINRERNANHNGRSTPSAFGQTLLVGLMLMGLMLFFVAAPLTVPVSAQAPTAEELLSCVQNNLSSFSFHGTMRISTFRTEFSREFLLEVWSGADNESVMMRVLEPEDEAGSGYLLLTIDEVEELWFFAAAAGTSIPLPSSSLSEAFFGTDLSIEDLYQGTLDQSFDSELLGTRTEDGATIHRLRLIPKADADVVFGKLELDLRDEDCALQRLDYFDQRDTLIRESLFSDFVEEEGIVFALRTRSNDLLEAGSFTEQLLESYEVNIDIPANRFTLDCLEDESLCD
jgi:outer membrane lipoprotein-sorting protein